MLQVWSFSPPEDVLYERPLSYPQGAESSNRPNSSLGFRKSDQGVPGSIRTILNEDIDMKDAGPSTAPLHRTFFNDD